MGWASGSGLAEDLWTRMRKFIPNGDPRRMAAREFIELFKAEDCDTIDEAECLCKDAGRVYDDATDRFVYRD